jgi:hypothetical protein
MQLRCSVSTYLLLNVPMSSPVARLANAFQYRRQLPCGSVETEPTKQPESTENHAALTFAKYSSFFNQIQANNIKRFNITFTDFTQIFYF